MGHNTIERLVADASSSSSGEIANAQLFIIRLCETLDLPVPDFSREHDCDNQYVFEKTVSFGSLNGRQRLGRIDLFKQGCFVLESKQSALAHEHGHASAPSGRRRRPRAVRRGSLAWSRAMTEARMQAEHYARSLAAPPPFLIILDVGHVMELYADFSGLGVCYAPFPDAGRHRIFMDDLRQPEIQRRLRLIWRRPQLLAREMYATPSPCDEALTRYLLNRAASRTIADRRRRTAPDERFAPCLGLRASGGGSRILV